MDNILIEIEHADGCTTNLGIIGVQCNCGSERQAWVTVNQILQQLFLYGGVIKFPNGWCGIDTNEGKALFAEFVRALEVWVKENKKK